MQRLCHGNNEQKNVLNKQKNFLIILRWRLPTLKSKKDMANLNLSDLILDKKLKIQKRSKRLIKNSGIRVNNLKIENDLPVSKINWEIKIILNFQ